MSDTAFFSQAKPHTLLVKSIATRVVAIATATRSLAREWRHNYRSRRELASYSHYERNDLNFAADVDTEIAKPFWSK